MSDIAIRVEGLSKQYRIGGKQERYRTLRDSLTDALVAPFRRAGKLLRGQATGAAELDDTIWALKDVSFEVKRGEVIGIIGRNGAGKSTLLKILSRITEPTEGHAEVYGRVGSLLEVGTGFHLELTGRENIYLNGAILGMKRQEIERKFDEIVAFAEIDQFIDTPVKHYSSGMGVRLGFAVAAHLDPEIMLVDEVLAVGDAAFRKKCLGHMQKEAGQLGRTILFVSHSMAQIRRLCQKAIWLNDGQIKQAGDAMDVSLAYETETVYQASNESGGVFVRSGPHDPDVWVSKVEMRDASGNYCTDFEYGDDIILDIHLSYGPDVASRGIGKMALNWKITDEGDVCISVDSMIHHMQDFDAGVRVVRCRISSIPLYKGTYKIELGVTQETIGRIDTWKGDIVFNVIYCDPVGHGYERDRRSGFVHIGSDWQIQGGFRSQSEAREPDGIDATAT